MKKIFKVIVLASVLFTTVYVANTTTNNSDAMLTRTDNSQRVMIDCV